MQLDAIGIAGTGMNLNQKWLDAIGDNLANIDDTTNRANPAFQERFVLAQADSDSGGVAVAGTPFGSAAGRLVYSLRDPNADAQGYVRGTGIDLSVQMTNLIMAQRAYQANANTVSSARYMYQSALQIGQK
nr:flagellar basal body rod C-terminal domain-containing protein [Leifsonia xyli]